MDDESDCLAGGFVADGVRRAAIEADVAGLVGTQGLDRLRADLRAIIDG